MVLDTGDVLTAYKGLHVQVRVSVTGEDLDDNVKLCVARRSVQRLDGNYFIPMIL
jgi:hypothetical protein